MLARRSLLTLLAADEGNWCRGGSYTTSPAPSTAVYRTPQIHMRGQLATLAAAVVLDFEELWTRWCAALGCACMPLHALSRFFEGVVLLHVEVPSSSRFFEGVLCCLVCCRALAWPKPLSWSGTQSIILAPRALSKQSIIDWKSYFESILSPSTPHKVFFRAS